MLQLWLHSMAAKYIRCGAPSSGMDKTNHTVPDAWNDNAGELDAVHVYSSRELFVSGMLKMKQVSPIFLTDIQASDMPYLRCGIQAITKVPHEVTRDTIGCSETDSLSLNAFYHIIYNTVEYQ